MSLAWLADHAEEIVNKVDDHPNLTDAQRRLLKEMLKVKPEERCTLRDVLSKGYFKTGEDTEEAKHVEVCTRPLPTPYPVYLRSALPQSPAASLRTGGISSPFPPPTYSPSLARAAAAP